MLIRSLNDTAYGLPASIPTIPRPLRPSSSAGLPAFSSSHTWLRATLGSSIPSVEESGRYAPNERVLAPPAGRGIERGAECSGEPRRLHL